MTTQTTKTKEDAMKMATEQLERAVLTNKGLARTVSNPEERERVIQKWAGIEMRRAFRKA